jgi:hypothetical protein
MINSSGGVTATITPLMTAEVLDAAVPRHRRTALRAPDMTGGSGDPTGRSPSPASRLRRSRDVSAGAGQRREKGPSDVGRALLV